MKRGTPLAPKNDPQPPNILIKKARAAAVEQIIRNYMQILGANWPYVKAVCCHKFNINTKESILYRASLRMYYIVF